MYHEFPGACKAAVRRARAPGAYRPRLECHLHRVEREVAVALEIERKFLIEDDSWRMAVRRSRELKQGYLQLEGKASVRVRVAGGTASLTIKSGTSGVARTEFEYPIPLADAELMLASLCVGTAIVKVRHHVPHAGHDWEIDEFAGDNTGLVLAELELNDVDEVFARPAWLGVEVSEDPRYYNTALVTSPFCAWPAHGPQ